MEYGDVRLLAERYASICTSHRHKEEMRKIMLEVALLPPHLVAHFCQQAASVTPIEQVNDMLVVLTNRLDSADAAHSLDRIASVDVQYGKDHSGKMTIAEHGGVTTSIVAAIRAVAAKLREAATAGEHTSNELLQKAKELAEEHIARNTGSDPQFEHILKSTAPEDAHTPDWKLAKDQKMLDQHIQQMLKELDD
jgi:hypothetical protein